MRIVFIISVVLVLAQPVYSQMLQVEEIRVDSGEAILIDQETGIRYGVTRGDAVGNWRIFSVEPDGVTIGKWGADQSGVVVTKLPAKKSPGAVMSGPR